MNNIIPTFYSENSRESDLLETRYGISCIALLGIDDNSLDAYRAMEMAIEAETAKDEQIYRLTIDSYVVDETTSWKRALNRHRFVLDWVGRYLKALDVSSDAHKADAIC